MHEQEPQYFKEFKKDFDGLRSDVGTLTTDLKNFRNDFEVFKVDITERLDGHAEQIADVSVKVTELTSHLDKKADKGKLVELIKEFVK